MQRDLNCHYDVKIILFFDVVGKKNNKNEKVTNEIM